MKTIAISRRSLLQSSACMLAAAAMPEIAGARAAAGLSPRYEQLIRKYYAAWGSKDWHALNMLLTDDFTFTSPNDDHDSKAVYKTRCWDPNVNLIGHFDLQQIAGNGNEAFVMYVAQVKGGKTIENVEHFTIKDGKVAAVRCYFGGQNSYPAGVVSGHG
ncbi:MAG: nuclear transport factor 2 family protein [Gammaproteobacteria bacterium]|nr:nuclear transport factor 2 family protein [Gammaproteobacteria bacterium]